MKDRAITNKEFNKFLKDNKDKIDSITPINPPLTREELEEDLTPTADRINVCGKDIVLVTTPWLDKDNDIIMVALARDENGNITMVRD